MHRAAILRGWHLTFLQVGGLIGLALDPSRGGNLIVALPGLPACDGRLLFLVSHLLEKRRRPLPYVLYRIKADVRQVLKLRSKLSETPPNPPPQKRVRGFGLQLTKLVNETAQGTSRKGFMTCTADNLRAGLLS